MRDIRYTTPVKKLFDACSTKRVEAYRLRTMLDLKNNINNLVLYVTLKNHYNILLRGKNTRDWV